MVLTGLRMGLTRDELREMPVCELVAYVEAWADMNDPREPEVREATEEDYANISF